MSDGVSKRKRKTKAPDRYSPQETPTDDYDENEDYDSDINFDFELDEEGDEMETGDTTKKPTKHRRIIGDEDDSEDEDEDEEEEGDGDDDYEEDDFVVSDLAPIEIEDDTEEEYDEEIEQVFDTFKNEKRLKKLIVWVNEINTKLNTIQESLSRLLSQ